MLLYCRGDVVVIGVVLGGDVGAVDGKSGIPDVLDLPLHICCDSDVFSIV